MILFERPRWWTAGAGLAGLLAAVLLSTMPAASLAEEDPSQGQATFDRYCASCHGVSATGDGPIADTLKIEPPNLTQLSKRNGGEFPRQEVLEVIDGRMDVKSHGPRIMPVWGAQFGARGGGEYAELTTTMLTDYLASIQEK